MSDFNFSPSVQHQYLLDNMEQKLAYKRGDIQ